MAEETTITEGFPTDWFVQLRENEALLCFKSFNGFLVAVCAKPRLISSEEWLQYAREIARGLKMAQAVDRLDADIKDSEA